MTLKRSETSILIGNGYIPKLVLSSTGLPCEVVSTGLADIIIPVSLGLLETITSNLNKISRFCKMHNAISVHLFELTPNNNQQTITTNCRNFAPLFGIPEESATGSACGALACYLTKITRLAVMTLLLSKGE